MDSLSKTNMEFDMDSIVSGAFWLPFFEDQKFNNTYLNDSRGHECLSSAQRRKMASDLLDVLDEDSIKREDEPCCVWLEEQMDLEVFGQSVIEASPTMPMDEEEEEEEPRHIVIPFSPSAPELSTPIQPISPQELHLPPEILPDVKLDPIAVTAAENAEFVQSLESLLHQIQTDNSTSSFPEDKAPEVDEDEAIALLDSLIKVGDEDKNKVFNKLTEVSLAMGNLSEARRPLPTPSISSNSSDSDEPNLKIVVEEAEDASRKTRTNTRSGSNQKAEPTKTPKTRARPYKPEERKIRKREQNKTAATRFRIKKKMEVELLKLEEATLEKENNELQARYDALLSEVRYLKKLLQEVMKN